MKEEIDRFKRRKIEVKGKKERYIRKERQNTIE